MGGTHPCIFTALDGPTVLFARKQVRLACYLHLLKESNSFLFTSGQFCPPVNAGPAYDGKYASRAAGVPEFQ
jgi:hypothetical protein